MGWAEPPFPQINSVDLENVLMKGIGQPKGRSASPHQSIRDLNYIQCWKTCIDSQNHIFNITSVFFIRSNAVSDVICFVAGAEGYEYVSCDSTHIMYGIMESSNLHQDERFFVIKLRPKQSYSIQTIVEMSRLRNVCNVELHRSEISNPWSPIRDLRSVILIPWSPIRDLQSVMSNP
jgi:hypothetical protein